MMRSSRSSLILGLTGFFLLASVHPGAGEVKQDSAGPNSFGAEWEIRLLPLAKKLGKPRRGEWRREHPQDQPQSFDEYIQQNPVRKSAKLTTIYVCLLGDFNAAQQKVIDANREYLEIFFQTPVKILHRVSLDKIPDRARRGNPSDGNLQILSPYVLNELLQPQRPRDALAYVAFTSTDLWTRDEDGKDWNFVFGQAQLRERVGVWSLARFPDPAVDQESFQRCLKLTLATASHETSHILTMPHCSEFYCSMNGSNHLGEAESKPLHFCPHCFRKLCWNLRLKPVDYCQKLEDFSEKHGLTDEVEYYHRAVEALERK